MCLANSVKFDTHGYDDIYGRGWYGRDVSVSMIEPLSCNRIVLCVRLVTVFVFL